MSLSAMLTILEFLPDFIVKEKIVGLFNNAFQEFCKF